MDDKEYSQNKSDWFITDASLPSTSPGQPESNAPGAGEFKIVQSADASKMVVGAGPEAVDPNDAKAMTKLKFGTETPSMTINCEICGKPYGHHHGHHCPVSSGMATSPPPIEAIFDDDGDEYDEDEDGDMEYQPGELKVPSTDVHPHIAIKNTKGGVKLIKQHRTLHRPMVDPKVTEAKYPLIAAAATWYVLEVLKNVYVPKAPLARQQMRSYERFVEWLNEEHAELTLELANVFYDYIALACWGEARHAWSYSTLVSPEISSRPIRYMAAREAVAFDPKAFLPVLEKLFKCAQWGGGSFGGTRWGKAAAYAQTRGTVSDAVFVDHCVDLVHNSGPLFSKAYIIQPVGHDSWGRLLNYKTHNKTGLIGITHANTFPVFYTAVTALERAISMEAAPEKWVVATTDHKAMDGPGYTPLKWGKIEIAPLLIATPKTGRCKICNGVVGICTCRKCHTCKTTGCTKHRYCESCGNTKFVKNTDCCDPYKYGDCSDCGENMEADCTCTFAFGEEYESKEQKEKEEKKVSKAASRRTAKKAG